MFQRFTKRSGRYHVFCGLIDRLNERLCFASRASSFLQNEDPYDAITVPVVVYQRIKKLGKVSRIRRLS